MYPEFIVIYVGLVIVIALLVAVLVMLNKLVNGNKVSTPRVNFSNTTMNMSDQSSSVHEEKTSKSIVFCKKCATEFDASLSQCPNCGTPR